MAQPGAEKFDIQPKHEAHNNIANDISSLLSGEAMAQGINNALKPQEQQSNQVRTLHEMLNPITILTDKDFNLNKQIEDYGKKVLEFQERPMNQTEQVFVEDINKAIKSNDVEAIQHVLGALSEHPESLKVVLSAVREGLQNDLTRVGWESGNDDQGKPFVRLHIDQNDSFSKSSGGTHITIGSDGTTTAYHTKMWNSPRTELDGAAALQNIAKASESLLPLHKKPLDDERLNDYFSNLKPGEK